MSRPDESAPSRPFSHAAHPRGRTTARSASGPAEACRAALVLLLIALSFAIIGCRAPTVRPAPLDTRNARCRFCGMAVSELRVAAQLAAHDKASLFFNDIGCLRDFLAEHPESLDRVAFVADHRTGSWIRANGAVYGRCGNVPTPRRTHLLAWADDTSRAADPARAGCSPVDRDEIIGSHSSSAER